MLRVEIRNKSTKTVVAEIIMSEKQYEELEFNIWCDTDYKITTKKI